MNTPYFNGREFIGTLPEECILDCSTPGQDAIESVEYWIKCLGFNAPEDYTREYLKGYGAWDNEELSDHDANLKRLLWIMCGNLREDREYPIYLEY